MLQGYAQALVGTQYLSSLSLTVGGKALRQPDRLIRESALVPYSLVICDYSQLEGGMKASPSKKKKSKVSTPKHLRGLSTGKSKRKPSRGKDNMLTSPTDGN